MTMAKIQPFCRENINNLGFLDRIGIIPRLVTDRNKALKLYKHQFCSL